MMKPRRWRQTRISRSSSSHWLVGPPSSVLTGALDFAKSPAQPARAWRTSGHFQRGVASFHTLALVHDLAAAVRLSINEAELFAKRFKSAIRHNYDVHRHVDVTD